MLLLAKWRSKSNKPRITRSISPRSSANDKSAGATFYKRDRGHAFVGIALFSANEQREKNLPIKRSGCVCIVTCTCNLHAPCFKTKPKPQWSHETHIESHPPGCLSLFRFLSCKLKIATTTPGRYNNNTQHQAPSSKLQG
jgi:hypothetical protein